MNTRTALLFVAWLGAAGQAAGQASTGASVQELQEERERLIQQQLAQMRLERDQARQRAVERCTLNRGVDCVTDEGLQEWLMQDRTRLEAVLDGARLRSGALPPEARGQ
jgi:hypothetical protein